MELKTQTSWTASFLTTIPETVIIYNTESGVITIVSMDNPQQVRVRTIPIEKLRNTSLTKEWVGNTITLESQTLGETTARFLNRTSSEQLYNALIASPLHPQTKNARNTLCPPTATSET